MTGRGKKSSLHRVNNSITGARETTQGRSQVYTGMGKFTCPGSSLSNFKLSTQQTPSRNSIISDTICRSPQEPLGVDYVQEALSWFKEANPFPIEKSSYLQPRSASSPAAFTRSARLSMDTDASFCSHQRGKASRRWHSSFSLRASKYQTATNTGRDRNSSEASHFARQAAATNPKYSTKGRIIESNDTLGAEVAGMNSTAFSANEETSLISPPRECLASSTAVTAGVVESPSITSARKNAARKRLGSQPRVSTSLNSSSSTFFPKAQAMVPVVHIRIRPLLPSMGESNKHRNVWFLDHENMVVRATASLLPSSPRSKQEGSILPPPSLTSLKAPSSTNAGNDPPMASFFNSSVLCAYSQGYTITTFGELRLRSLPLNGVVNCGAGSESMGRLSPTLELSTPTQRTIDPLNHSVTTSSAPSLVEAPRMEHEKCRSGCSSSRGPNLAAGSHRNSVCPKVSSMDGNSFRSLDINQTKGGSRAKHRKRGKISRNSVLSVAVSKKRDNSRMSNGHSSVENGKSNPDKHFRFEFIYDEDSTQEEVFEESVLRIADEALLGRNVSILCYGPTGSGKTYSMMGSHNSKFFGTAAPSSTSQRHREEGILSQLFPHTNCRADDNSQCSDYTGNNRRNRPRGWRTDLWKQEESAPSSQIDSEDPKSIPVRPVVAAAATMKLSNTPLDADEGGSVCLSEADEHGELRFSNNMHGDRPRKFIVGARDRAHPKPGTCISADMGILPRLVCALLDRRGRAVKFSKEYSEGARTLDNTRSKLDQSMALGAPSKSDPPKRRAGTVSLTLKELTFYGIELYVDGVYDLMDPNKRAITNLSDTGGLVALCKQLDQAREDAAEAASRKRNGSDVKKTGGGIPITSLKDLSSAYRLARRNRITSVHAQNDTSSRSHAVFIIQVGFSICENPIGSEDVGEGCNDVSTALRPTDNVGKHAASFRHIMSYVAMVDLAGCERLKVTQVKGSALREAQYINKSLSALSSVVLSLYSHSKHVPYRDSKLTRILRPCLEDGRVLVLVHVSPCSGSEAFNSLRFADQVRHVYFQVHHFNDAANKRRLMNIFEDIIDPEQGRLELAFQQVLKYYDCLCAEVRLAYMTCIDPTVAVANFATPALSLPRGIFGLEEHPSSSLFLRTEYSADNGHGDKSTSRLTLPLTPNQADLRFFRVYSTTYKSVASLRESENSFLRERVAMILQERDRCVKLSQQRTEQEISSLRMSIDELTRINASLAEENMSLIPVDPYCEGLLKEIKALTEECGDAEKAIAGLSSCAAVLRQRLVAIDEIDHGLDVELDEIGCDGLPAEAMTAGQFGHSYGSSIKSSSPLAPMTCQDPELREIAHQQVMLSRSLSLLRLEIACFEIGNHIWQGLWARAMRQELLVSVHLELALMERVLLGGVLMGDTLSDNVLSKGVTHRIKKIHSSEKDLDDKASRAIIRLRKRLKEYLQNHPQKEHRILGKDDIVVGDDEVTTAADLPILQGDATMGTFLASHSPSTSALELEVSDILNPLAHLNFLRESSCRSDSLSPTSVALPKGSGNTDQIFPPRFSGMFGFYSHIGTSVDQFPLTLFDTYDDEKALQQVSVRKLLEEGIACEVCCVGDPFNVVYERFLCPEPATSVEDSFPSTVTLTMKNSARAWRQGDGIDTSDLSRDSLKGEDSQLGSSLEKSESGGQSAISINPTTFSLGEMGMTNMTPEASKQEESISIPMPTTVRWGLLKLVRHTRPSISSGQVRPNRRSRCSTTLNDEARSAYSLDFVYTEDGLPLPSRAVEALGLISARHSKVEESDDLLSSATNANKELRGLESSEQAQPAIVLAHEQIGAAHHAHAANSHVRTSPREHHLFTIPLDAPELLFNAHLLEVGTTRTSPALSHSNGLLINSDDTLQVGLELSRLPLTNEEAGLESQGLCLHPKEDNPSQPPSSLGLVNDAPILNDIAQTVSSAAKLTHESPNTPPVRSIQLSNGNELLLPSVCASSSKETCTLLLRFPAPFYSNSTRLESAETIIAGLCSLMPRPYMHHASGKVGESGCAMHHHSDAPSPEQTLPPGVTPMNVGGVRSVVCRYFHVPYALPPSGRIQEVDSAYTDTITNLEIDRDTTSATRGQKGGSPEPHFLRTSGARRCGGGGRPRNPQKKPKGRPDVGLVTSPTQAKASVSVARLQVWLHFPESSATTESSLDLQEDVVLRSITSAFRILQQLRSVTLGRQSGSHIASHLSYGAGGPSDESHSVLLFHQLKSLRRKTRNLIKQHLYEAEDIEDSTSISLFMYPSHVREVEHNVRETMGFFMPPPNSVSIDPMPSSGGVYVFPPDPKRSPTTVPNFLLNSYVDPSRLAPQYEVSVKLGRQLGSLSVSWTIWQWAFRWASLGNLHQDQVFTLGEGLGGTMTNSLLDAHRGSKNGVPAGCPIIPCPITGTTVATISMSSTKRFIAGFDVPAQNTLSDDGTLGTDQEGFEFGTNEDATIPTSPPQLQIWLPELYFNPAPRFLLSKEEAISYHG